MRGPLGWELRRAVRHRAIGHGDWGNVRANGEYRCFTATIECYEVIERLPEIVDAIRAALSRLRRDYFANFYIALRVRPSKPTEAQADMLRRFHDEQEQAEFERKRHEEQERQEQLYLYRLKQEQGEPIDPEEFAPGPREPLPPPPWKEEDEEESDDDENDSDGAGGTAVKEKPDPPPDLWDDEHPLADNYRLAGTVRPGELWIANHAVGLAIHLMNRDPDEVFPEEEKPA